MRKQAMLWALAALLTGAAVVPGTVSGMEAGTGITAGEAAHEEPGLRVGTVVGEAVATDIRAYVNGHPIPSMNIDGYTAVAAEDLRSYGFDVAWSPREAAVTIYPRRDKTVRPQAGADEAAQPPGTKLADVLHTNIRAFYAERPIRSYNIGGRTAVLLNDLRDMGTVEWSPEERTIRFAPSDSESAELSPAAEAPLAVRERSTIRLDDIRIGEQAVTYAGREIGKVVDGRAMISLRFIGEAFGYESTCDEKPGSLNLCLGDGSFGLVTYAVEDNRVVQLLWMGGERNWLELSVPVVADVRGDWPDVLVYERDLQWLFGYLSQWDPETGLLDIQYVDYAVDDFGVPETSDNYLYALSAVGRISGQGGELPHILIRPLSPNVMPSVSSGALLEEGKDGGLPKYGFATSARLELGSPYFEVEMSVGARLLYHKTIGFRMGPEDVRPGFDVNALLGSGQFSHVVFDQAERALLVSETGEATISGTAEPRVGSGLMLAVEKSTCENCWVWEEPQWVDVPFREDGRFEAKLTFPAEPWLYQIRVYSELETPRFVSKLEIGRYFVEIPRRR